MFTRLNDNGRRLRGLYILRSETDKRSMVCAGNLFTRYNYRLVKVRLEAAAEATRVETLLPDGTSTMAVSFAAGDDTLSLPSGSPFPEWRTARRFAGPMPFTFSTASSRAIVVIEASRQDWVPTPVMVTAWQVGLFDEAPFRGVKPILANAFSTKHVSYRWERGRFVQMGGAD